MKWRLFPLLLLFACSEVNTSNADKAYYYWSDAAMPNNIEVINGQYWQSPHWTLEYIAYFQIKPSQEWWDVFQELRSIEKDSVPWTIPEEAPAWFEPSESSIGFTGGSPFGHRPLYILDTAQNYLYIYEIQL